MSDIRRYRVLSDCTYPETAKDARACLRGDVAQAARIDALEGDIIPEPPSEVLASLLLNGCLEEVTT